MRPIELRVTFGGLGLFLPTKGQLDILMPPTGPGSYGEVEQHNTYLVLPDRYTGGGASSSGCHTETIDGLCVVLRSGSPDPNVKPEVPDELFNVCPFAGQDIDPVLLHPNSVASRLNARLTLIGGSYREPFAEAKFLVDGKKKNLAHAVEWVLDGVQGPEITLTFFKLQTPNKPEKEVKLSTLTNRIDIGIFHVPKHDTPTCQPGPHMPHNKGELAVHTNAYYGLFDDPKRIVIPVYDGNLPSSSTGSGGESDRSSHHGAAMSVREETSTEPPVSRATRGGDPVTCLCGQC